MITLYLDNDHVHLLDEEILNVINEKLVSMDNLVLTSEQQSELTSIVHNRLGDGDEKKVALWNKVLEQVRE